MNSISNLNHKLAGLPLVADDILEFHAARLLLLFRFCGTAGKIQGLTKMAKLDFFVRYPRFFEAISDALGERHLSGNRSVESTMVRFHYGPWDKRYYHVLAYLEAKDLINVKQNGNQFVFALTELGQNMSGKLAKSDSFSAIIAHMKIVKKVLGAKSGSTLKKWIYQVFDNEVAQRSMGEIID